MRAAQALGIGQCIDQDEPALGVGVEDLHRLGAGADALSSGRGGGSLTGRSRLLPKALWAGIILVVAGCLALVGLNVYQMLYVAPALGEERDLVVHAYSVIATAHGIERSLREAESSERGYIITGEQRYLDDAYGNGMKAAPELLAMLEQLSAANPEQHRRVLPPQRQTGQDGRRGHRARSGR